MSTVQEHYDRHLGPVYAWMAGGIEPALERGAAEPLAPMVQIDIGNETR